MNNCPPPELAKADPGGACAQEQLLQIAPTPPHCSGKISANMYISPSRQIPGLQRSSLRDVVSSHPSAESGACLRSFTPQITLDPLDVGIIIRLHVVREKWIEQIPTRCWHSCLLKCLVIAVYGPVAAGLKVSVGPVAFCCTNLPAVWIFVVPETQRLRNAARNFRRTEWTSANGHTKDLLCCNANHQQA